jgi:RNA polymerase primary sigma factor
VLLANLELGDVVETTEGLDTTDANPEFASDVATAFKQQIEFFKRIYGYLDEAQDFAFGNQVRDGLLLSDRLDVDAFDPGTEAYETVRLAKQAREVLVGTNMAWIAAVAKRYIGRGVPYEDLLMEGVAGAVRATQTYEPEKGYRFKTYATWWIRQNITRSIENTGQTIRVPGHLEQALYKITRRLEEDPGADLETLCADPDIDANPELVRDALASRRVGSMQEQVGSGRANREGEGLTFEDLLPDPNDVIGAVDDRLSNTSEILWVGVCRVIRAVFAAEQAERLEQIMASRMVDGKTLEATAGDLEPVITRERVRQLQNKAIAPVQKLGRAAVYAIGESADVQVPIEDLAEFIPKPRGPRRKAALADAAQKTPARRGQPRKVRDEAAPAPNAMTLTELLGTTDIRELGISEDMAVALGYFALGQQPLEVAASMGVTVGQATRLINAGLKAVGPALAA